MFGMGDGNRINAQIEAERLARERGRPDYPDTAEEAAERQARRAAWVISGLGVVGVTWWIAGIAFAAIVLVGLAIVALAVWWVRSRLEDRAARHSGA